MFEVGKKYVKADGDIVECVFVGTKRAVLREVGGIIEHCPDFSIYHNWKEYKEPRTITRWVNVYEDGGGKLVMSTYTYHTKEQAINDFPGLKKSDTIPITYTEPH